MPKRAWRARNGHGAHETGTARTNPVARWDEKEGQPYSLRNRSRTKRNAQTSFPDRAISDLACCLPAKSLSATLPDISPDSKSLGLNPGKNLGAVPSPRPAAAWGLPGRGGDRRRQPGLTPPPARMKRDRSAAVRRPTEAQPPKAFTMATLPKRIAFGSRSQAATSRAIAVGRALDSALLLSVTEGLPRDIAPSFASYSRQFLHARRAIHSPGGLFFRRARPPAGQSLAGVAVG